MVFRRFYLLLVTRILILAANAILSGYFVFRPGYVFTSIFLAVLFVAQVISLIYFLNRINNQLATFAEYIGNEDPKVSFTEKGSLINDKQLFKYFSHLSDIVAGYRSREKRWQSLLDQSIGNIEAGILVLGSDYRIEVVNRKARSFLNLGHERGPGWMKFADPGLLFAIQSIGSGQRKIYKYVQKDNYRQLLLRSTTFRLYEEELKLVYMQDIRNELQDKEMESWQKLIRVITHEVNNTVSPVTSLTTLLLEQLISRDKKVSFASDGNELCDKTIEGLRIINERNEGLLRFVREFRFSALPPRITPVHFSVNETFRDTGALFTVILADRNILYSHYCQPETLILFADQSLFSQVMINLVKNAIESFEGTTIDGREITCTGKIDEEDRTVIEVADNGPGIPGSILDRIFIPFFTTREKGNGIGLSFSRQVVRKHHGTIEVFSEYGRGSRFVIKI